MTNWQLWIDSYAELLGCGSSHPKQQPSNEKYIDLTAKVLVMRVDEQLPPPVEADTFTSAAVDEIDEAVSRFNYHLSELVLSIAGRCGRKCATVEDVRAAIKEVSPPIKGDA